MLHNLPQTQFLIWKTEVMVAPTFYIVKIQWNNGLLYTKYSVNTSYHGYSSLFFLFGSKWKMGKSIVINFLKKPSQMAERLATFKNSCSPLHYPRNIWFFYGCRRHGREKKDLETWFFKILSFALIIWFILHIIPKGVWDSHCPSEGHKPYSWNPKSFASDWMTCLG